MEQSTFLAHMELLILMKKLRNNEADHTVLQHEGRFTENAGHPITLMCARHYYYTSEWDSGRILHLWYHFLFSARISSGPGLVTTPQVPQQTRLHLRVEGHGL